MPTLADVRKQHPGAYDDLSDGQLADALYTKFYSDVPREQFNAKVGLSAPAKPVAKTKVQADAESRVAGTPNVLRALTSGITWGGGGDIDALGAGLETGVNNALAKFGMTKGAGYSPEEAYHAVKAANVSADQKFQEAHPVQAAGLNVLGAITAPGSGAAGKFVMNGATTGARLLRGALVAGAGGGAYGALASPEGERTKNALIGTATGLVTGGTTQGVLNKFGPQAAKTGVARVLSRAGVDLTPGQMAGGVAKSIEDKLTSAPMTGQMINKARTRGLDDFRRATIDQALEPLGAKLPTTVTTGNDGYAAAEKTVGDAYNKILPGLTFNLDNQFATDFSKLSGQINTLPKDRGDQVTRIIRDKVLTPLQNGGFTGQTWKQADSELGRLGATYRGSPDADQREVGRVLQDAQTAMRDWMVRSNPKQAPDIQKANTAWANITRLRDATAATGANSNGGEWTPAQLLAATRKGDKSMAKGATARGEALLQDWAQTGQAVLPNKVPDSGTAGRGLATTVLLGAGALNPVALKAATVDAVGAALYTKPVQTLLNNIYRATDRQTATQGLQGLKVLAQNNPKLLPLVQEVEARLSQTPNALARYGSSKVASGGSE